MNRQSDRGKQQNDTRPERGGNGQGVNRQRQWRVFEYRRPTPARPRFTT
jgi:hypothetical protein